MSLRRGLALLGLLILPSCLDPIVGTQCATGYSPCHGACVATGACAALDDAGGMEGDAGVALDSTIAATSVDADGIGEAPAIDAEPGDAKIAQDVPARDDASGQDDAPALGDIGPPPIVAVDASLDEGEPIDEGSFESARPCVDCVDTEGAGEGGNGDDARVDDAGYSAVDGALVCAEPQVICNDQCVDLALDPENCGECNTLCGSGVCINGGCLVCADGESVCGRACANLSTDPDNCGFCGYPCMSGLCSDGQCEAAGTGRAIVIGHDYLRKRPAMNRILGNAVFLWPVNPVRLLVYEGNANATAVAGADAAIAQVASATGRLAIRTAAGSADVSALLAATDVFLIYGQELASDATLRQLGLDWAAALLTFVNTGGTVVLLDGVYASNSGTCQILAQAGLFQLARDASTTGDVCTVIARGDALTTGLPQTYLCEMNSTSFVVSDLATPITPVVEDSGRTVVVHKLF
jgi:hypothetical protein